MENVCSLLSNQDIQLWTGLGGWTPVSKYPAQAQVPCSHSPRATGSPCQEGKGASVSSLSTQPLPSVVSTQPHAQLSSQALERGALLIIPGFEPAWADGEKQSPWGCPRPAGRTDTGKGREASGGHCLSLLLNGIDVGSDLLTQRSPEALSHPTHSPRDAEGLACGLKPPQAV